MNGKEYIIEKQKEWAARKNIDLIGSKVTSGEKVFTKDLNDNLFRPLCEESLEEFKSADGHELTGKDGNPGKMQALHSSSALAVNVFQYWKEKSAIHDIAAACGFCKKGSTVSKGLVFEKKFPIDDSLHRHPNIDVAIHNDTSCMYKCFAVESKFSEAYSSYKHNGLNSTYMDMNDIWQGIPHLHEFAKSISPSDESFKHLHPAQLITHILGLKNQYGKNHFRLLYLWYDVLGEDGKDHRDEIGKFTKVTDMDGINFHSLSYQELIIRLAKEFRDGHSDYISYISERYL